MAYQIWPVYEVSPGVCSVRDEVLSECWRRIVALGHVERVFWTGGVVTEGDFQRLMHGKNLHPIVICDGDEPVMLAWLSYAPMKGWMNAHFCALAPYRPGPAEEGMRFWAACGLVGVLGLIPETHRTAHRFVDRLRWQKVGRIEAACHLEHEQRRVAGILYSYVFDERG